METRIDAHQHFWDYDPDAYPWIGDDMEVLKHDFSPHDLSSILRAHGFDGSIVVQARHSVAETRTLLEEARSRAFLRGVVGWVDLTDPAADRQLATLAQDRHLVGIRHLVQDEPDDDFLLRPEFRRGISHLAEHGLVYDLLLHTRHLKAALKLVREFPEQLFVLDHLAKPGIGRQELDLGKRRSAPWHRAPNVACKVSGMVTEADWRSWKTEDFHPYLDVAFEAFGEDRLLFGSDWPVCLLAAEYGQVLEIVEQYAGSLGQDAQAKLFGGNAARIYALIPEESRDG